jgi:mycothiol S-conjugate amidase
VLRLLAVHAHPDDESSKGAATYAWYRSRGARVMVVSCTGGERGGVLNSALESRTHADRDMGGFRRGEMARAREVLGVEHRWLGYHDSGLPPEGVAAPANSFGVLPAEISARPLVRIIRDFKPQVLVTYDENGGYPHPDHIRTHDISVLAFDAAADPERYPGTGEPWQISKLYYDRIFNADRVNAVYETIAAIEPPHPDLEAFQGLVEWMGKRQHRITTRVPSGDFFESRDAALRAHASQVPPDDRFWFWPNDLQRAAWPTEDFELVRTHVETDLPEHDLFAGIPDSEDPR